MKKYINKIKLESSDGSEMGVHYDEEDCVVELWAEGFTVTKDELRELMQTLSEMFDE